MSFLDAVQMVFYFTFLRIDDHGRVSFPIWLFNLCCWLIYFSSRSMTWGGKKPRTVETTESGHTCVKSFRPPQNRHPDVRSRGRFGELLTWPIMERRTGVTNLGPRGTMIVIMKCLELSWGLRIVYRDKAEMECCFVWAFLYCYLGDTTLPNDAV